MRNLLACLIGLVVTLGLGYLTITAAPMDVSGTVPKDELEVTKLFIQRVEHRQNDQAIAMFEPDARRGDTSILDQAAALLSKQKAEPPRALTWNSMWHESTNVLAGGAQQQTTHVLVLRYGLEDGTGLDVTATFRSSGGPKTLFGVHFQRIGAQQLQGPDFNLRSLTTAQAAALVIAVGIDVFAIATFVICLTGSLPSWRTRWLWLIAILIGIFRFNIVWPSCQTFVVPISFLFPPATLSQIPIGSPWVISISIPIGALVYWSLRRTRGWDARVRPEQPFSAPQF